ncbi:hypothetical protein JKP88DRAFT_265591 [Tribonema minus]|uniref:Uncharacterized protein n=1 Tax=Tribonema minus TaxID=303371 RepID=A0A836C7L6_9STRA|nr:hypothetical protein JKP88DRAFT_265591 [Tribonema minus]
MAGNARAGSQTELDTDQRALNSLVDRAEALLRKRWLTATFAGTAPPEDVEAAAMELPIVMTELQSIQAVLRHLHPDAEGIAPMRGLLSLTATLRILEQRSAAVQDAVGNGERPCCRMRAESPATAEVLMSNELLTTILSFVGPGNFLFVAPTELDTDQRALNSLVDRAEALLRKRWLTATFAGTAPPEDVEAAAMELPIVMTELQSIQAVLRHLHPDAEGIAPMRGLLSLTATLRILEQRSAAVQDAVGNGERPCCRMRAESPATAEVLMSNELLTTILSFVGPGNFLFVAPLPQAESWPSCYINALCNEAAMWGRINSLDFLLTRGQQLFGALGTISADSQLIQAFPSLKFVDAKDTEHTMTLTDAAAAADNIAVLQWLQSRHALEFTNITMPVAASDAVLPDC